MQFYFNWNPVRTDTAAEHILHQLLLFLISLTAIVHNLLLSMSQMGQVNINSVLDWRQKSQQKKWLVKLARCVFSNTLQWRWYLFMTNGCKSVRPIHLVLVATTDLNVHPEDRTVVSRVSRYTFRVGGRLESATNGSGWKDVDEDD